MRFQIFAACLILLSCPFVATAVEEKASSPSSYYEQTLREKNIQPTTEGLNDYFRSLHPSAQQKRRAVELIKLLGSSDSFAVRENATAKLLVMPVLPSQELIQASQGGDPEVRWRAAHILKVGKPESTRVFFAAFRVIEDKKLRGVVKELLRAIPLCDKQYLRHAAQEALAAAADEGDADMLREALASDNVELRLAAVRALGKALGNKAARDFQRLSRDADSQVRLFAVQARADYGDRDSLNELVSLLAADEVRVRVAASVALRQLSGKHFAFAAYDLPEKRGKAIDAWKKWVEGDGRTAKLHFPLKRFGAAVSYLGGNTLLAFGYRNKVAEYDPSDREVWSYTCQGPWSAEKMPNGNVLIAEYNRSRVIEVTPGKSIVWEHSVPSPLNAKPLANGNFLIAQHGGNRFIELTRDKKVVWEYRSTRNASDAHRLDNGNTLTCSWGGPTQEVTPDGKVVWQHTGINSYGCQPLPNGNILLCDWNQNRVIELTREKKIVWEFKETYPVDAFRLPSGNTLITGSNRFVEVTPDKKVIWSKQGCNYGTARR